MKKIMFAAVAAIAATTMADVESANVVGYNSLTIYHGMNMVCVNFKNMADSEGYTLDQLFPGNTPGLTAFRASSRADYVQKWDASPSGGAYSGDKFYLYVSASTNNAAADFTWRKSASVASTLKVKSGDAFWFYHYGPDTVTIPASGEVEFSSTTSPTITIHHGMNMIGAPYAAGLNLALKDANYWKTSGATAFRASSRADYVQAWNASVDGGAYSGDKYYLYVSASTNNAAADFTWRKSASVAAPDTVTTMGQGIWYYHYGDNSFTLELPFPYDL